MCWAAAIQAAARTAEGHLFPNFVFMALRVSGGEGIAPPHGSLSARRPLPAPNSLLMYTYEDTTQARRITKKVSLQLHRLSYTTRKKSSKVNE